MIGTTESSGFALQVQSGTSYQAPLRMYFNSTGKVVSASYGSSKNNWKEGVNIGLGLGSRGYNSTIAYYLWNSGASSPSWALLGSYDYTSYTSNNTIHVFGYDTSNTSPNWGIAHVYIYQHDVDHTDLNDGLIMQLYPCKRSDGICGLYDNLNNKFYSGTYKPEEWTIV